MTFRPRFITFDCYGTLIDFQMAEAAREVYGPRLPADTMDRFVGRFRVYRLDEVLGAWKPFRDVIASAVERACRATGLPFDAADAEKIFARIPGWGPHPDVPEGLSRVAKEIPLVILSNADNEQIMSNVEKLGAPFTHVLTAQDAQAYKPRLRAFEYMLDTLGVGPEEILHCSSSFRYDLMSAHDMGIVNKVWVNRGHEPATPEYGYTEIRSIGELARVVDL